ncbi:MAG: GNAT family N-acetyltransferase [Thermomicrobia bacterium]|nr:GNAT family N-acetyltransferase [Thermomicrobia bacterium]MCA1724913.1 GNAT family N-acetyltransferase [Thermomicrobia bacterium]
MTRFTIVLHHSAPLLLYNATMHTRLSFISVAPDAYAALLPLVPDEPWAVFARAALLAGKPGVYADAPRGSAAVAIDTPTPEGRSVFLFGDPDHPVIEAYVRALVGPVRISAARTIARQLSAWRPDIVPNDIAICAFPPTAAGEAFAALPPGGVRRLRPADARYLAAFPAWLWETDDTPGALLRQGIVYARYLRTEIVSLACTTATTERYTAIAAYTIERTRRNGFARECMHRLIGAILSERGTQPVLLAENDAAIGLAHSLGLTARHDHIVYDLA